MPYVFVNWIVSSGWSRNRVIPTNFGQNERVCLSILNQCVLSSIDMFLKTSDQRIEQITITSSDSTKNCPWMPALRNLAVFILSACYFVMIYVHCSVLFLSLILYGSSCSIIKPSFSCFTANSQPEKFISCSLCLFTAAFRRHIFYTIDNWTRWFASEHASSKLTSKHARSVRNL